MQSKIIMNKNAKIYVAGHRGLVGSAIVKNLESKGYINIITKAHAELDLINQLEVEAFFKKEQPEYVILAAAKVGGIDIRKHDDSKQCDSSKLYPRCKKTIVFRKHLYLP